MVFFVVDFLRRSVDTSAYIFRLTMIFRNDNNGISVSPTSDPVFVFSTVGNLSEFRCMLGEVPRQVFSYFRYRTFISRILRNGCLLASLFLYRLFTYCNLILRVVETMSTSIRAVVKGVWENRRCGAITMGLVFSFLYRPRGTFYWVQLITFRRWYYLAVKRSFRLDDFIGRLLCRNAVTFIIIDVLRNVRCLLVICRFFYCFEVYFVRIYWKLIVIASVYQCPMASYFRLLHRDSWAFNYFNARDNFIVVRNMFFSLLPKKRVKRRCVDSYRCSFFPSIQ